MKNAGAEVTAGKISGFAADTALRVEHGKKDRAAGEVDKRGHPMSFDCLRHADCQVGRVRRQNGTSKKTRSPFSDPSYATVAVQKKLFSTSTARYSNGNLQQIRHASSTGRFLGHP